MQMLTPEHERYLWLREGTSRNRGYCGSAPFVMNPRKSKLYAIAELRIKELDVAVDADILNNKMQQLQESNQVRERELSNHAWYSEEYCNTISVLAVLELGWNMTRGKAALDYLGN